MQWCCRRHPPPAPCPPLSRCFGTQWLAPACRHISAALVCRRWAAAVNSPELLHSLDLTLGGCQTYGASNADTTACLLRGWALLNWLLRRSGGAVQQLQLHLAVPYKASTTDVTELRMLLDNCLAACGPQLGKLTLSCADDRSPAMFDVPWLGNVQQLHTLELESKCTHTNPNGQFTVMTPLRLPASLSSLSSLGSLSSLSIRASRLVISSGVALPPALTHLRLTLNWSGELVVTGAFSQVSQWVCMPLSR